MELERGAPTFREARSEWLVSEGAIMNTVNALDQAGLSVEQVEQLRWLLLKQRTPVLPRCDRQTYRSRGANMGDSCGWSRPGIDNGGGGNAHAEVLLAVGSEQRH